MIILDTDVIMDLLRRYTPAVIWLTSPGHEEIALPGFVAMELIQGCRNRSELQHLQNALTTFNVIWPSPETCDKALAVFAQVHLSHNLGLLDALIGQMAISSNLPLYSFNEKHYAALSDLRATQPYKRST